MRTMGGAANWRHADAVMAATVSACGMANRESNAVSLGAFATDEGGPCGPSGAGRAA